MQRASVQCLSNLVLCVCTWIHMYARSFLSVKVLTQRRFLLADVEYSRTQLGDALHLHSDAAARSA